MDDKDQKSCSRDNKVFNNSLIDSIRQYNNPEEWFREYIATYPDKIKSITTNIDKHIAEYAKKLISAH